MIVSVDLLLKFCVCTQNIQLSIRSAAPGQFLLVLCGSIAGVFGLVVFARESGSSAM